MTPETRLELERLLSGVLDGDAADADHDRLEALLRGDIECRRHYSQYVDMHARLLNHPKLGSLVDWPALADKERRTEAEQTEASVGEIPLPTQARDDDRLWGIPRPRLPQSVRYVLVSAITLAASLLVQAYFFPFSGGTSAEAAAGDYVATITRCVQCEWSKRSEPHRVGSRLMAGDVRLDRGVAELRFDSGAFLVLQGPVHMRIENETAATLTYGKVVFRSDETAEPFDLRTPASVLVDYGTEYAVAVGDKGVEEVHVYDGEVVRTPRSDKPTNSPMEHVKAGEARRYAKRQSAGETVLLNERDFVRKVVEDRRPVDAVSHLLAAESFNYSSVQLEPVDAGSEGIGFHKPWSSRTPKPFFEIGAGLNRPFSSYQSSSGSIVYHGQLQLNRRLAKPLPLNVDAVYYMSYLYRRLETAKAPPAGLSVVLRNSKSKEPHQRFVVGVGGVQPAVFLNFEKGGARASLPMANDQTYLLVAKIVASKSSRDQAFVRIYGADARIEADEPSGWSAMTKPVVSDDSYDTLTISGNTVAKQAVDEIRLGSTWHSVVGPWLTPPQE